MLHKVFNPSLTKFYPQKRQDTFPQHPALIPAYIISVLFLSIPHNPYNPNIFIYNLSWNQNET